MKRKRTRTYVKAARAESEAGTRDRIVEAVYELHEEVGPLHTTVKAIAERAGVQRLTVYRHFPGQNEMIAACSARWNERFPPPDLAAAAAVRDPRRRARELLTALYGYYRSAERMLANVLADAPHMPAVQTAIAPLGAYLELLVAELERAWRGGKSASRRATLQHAVQFTTWRSLAQLTGGDADA